MSENQQKVIISIKNNTDKEFNDVSIFNKDIFKEHHSILEYEFPKLEDGTPFLDFLSGLKEPIKVEFFRYQYYCEDSNNDNKQLDSKFTIWLDKKIASHRFINFFSSYQQQKNILDIVGGNIKLNLYHDLDVVLERIMPKTSVAITFFFND